MRNYVTKGALTLACLALILVPASAEKGAASGCAAADVKLGSYTASAGGWVGVYGSIQNCSGGKKRYTVDITATSSCGVETMISHYRSAFNPMENKLYSSVLMVPPDTCPGLGTVTVSVYDGTTMLTSVSTSLTVQ
jgi:hypothetical protein